MATTHGRKPRTQRDHETRMTAEHHEDLRLWLRMLSCTNLVEAQIRSRLRLAFGTTLPRFDLMSQLERHPEGLKMGELARRMMVTGGNVTGITDQLVAENLVVREDNPRDRRAYMVKLTKKGREVFGAMAREHEHWIVELFAGLADARKHELYALLAELKAHVATLEPRPAK
ncbi:MAG TPA: MarR family transcriptional regulator [Rhodocyclaceae bacterium]|nr:MAG: MarR family transcriptional regulator [Betaproteobacteria bacterium CG2_30_68_42]PJA58137.1 MAG: MarR family transcriptional regulator [Rhodocyclales bacterium CG_4_9_14_3_um_filter_68_10]HCX32784.1 MarR family transcriptional regulator [Rhodocyclaceae bacterium]